MSDMKHDPKVRAKNPRPSFHGLCGSKPPNAKINGSLLWVCPCSVCDEIWDWAMRADKEVAHMKGLRLSEFRSQYDIYFDPDLKFNFKYWSDSTLVKNLETIDYKQILMHTPSVKA